MIENELFSLDQYSAAPGSPYKKKKYSVYETDPAWDDGTAFPEISSKNISSENMKNEFEVGDRILLRHTTRTGIVTEAFPDGNGHIQWDDWDVANDGSKYALSTTYLEKLPPLPAKQEEFLEENDRWNPEHFGENPPHEVTSDGQLTIFYDSSGEPPEPDDYQSIEQYEEAWKQWEHLQQSQQQDLLSSTYVRGWALVFAWLENASASTSEELQKSMITAQISSASDSQASQTTEISTNLQPSGHELMDIEEVEELTLSQPPLHASPSPSEESEKEPTTPETASPQSLQSLNDFNPTTQSLRMCQDSSTALIDREVKDSTVTTSLTDSEPQDTDWKRVSFRVGTLPPPLIDSGYYWLPAPTALSTQASRPPGYSKLETFLKEREILKDKEVINPEFLEMEFGLPLQWTNPQDTRPASEFLAGTELIEIEGKPLVTCSIPESLRSHSEESSTLSQSAGADFSSKNDEAHESQIGDFSSKNKLECKPFIDESNTNVPSSKNRGCLYKYLENKKLKDGRIVSYPRVEGARDPDNPSHWRWGFNWEEKHDGVWKGKSIGSVPTRILSMVKAMQKLDTPLADIVNFIKQSKGRKQD